MSLSKPQNRFATLDEGDLERLINDKDSKNTKRATNTATKIFREYVESKGYDNEDIENLTVDTLNQRLRSFYAEVRTTSGERYKRTSLMALRCGLCRYFNQTRDVDIIRDPEFKRANEMFVSVCKNTCKNGKGTITHKVPIEKADLELLYSSRAFDTNSHYGLLNKVWFELCLYFCSRGRENQRELKPSMFSIHTDASGKRYVFQDDSEVTKNHQGKKTIELEDKNVRMYESGGRFCPVKSFEKYLAKRNQDCEAFFQTPRNAFYDDDSSWYENRPLGKNKLGSMMKELSAAAGLSQQYTNHCIRATAITALSYAGFEARHIMTVSGHRSEGSVKSYVRDTTTAQKKEMSHTLSNLAESTVQNDNLLMLEDGLDAILALSLSQTEAVLKDISEFENSGNKNNAEISTNASRCHSQTLQVSNMSEERQSFSFHGCQIQFYNYN